MLLITERKFPLINPIWKLIQATNYSVGSETAVGTGGANGRRGAKEEWPYLGVGVSWGGRGLIWAWRRGVGLCVLLVAASFSLFLVTSSRRAGGLYTRVIFTFNNAPGYIMDIMVPSHNASKSSSSFMSSSLVHSSSTSSSPVSSSTSPSTSGKEDEDEEGDDDDEEDEEKDKEKEEEEEEDDRDPPKGFLVHTPGCVIPDFDPFHHTITRFISNPVNLTCKQPPALTSATGTTLHYHQQVLNDNMETFLKVYEQRLRASLVSPDNTSVSNGTNGSGTSPNGTVSFHLSPESFRRFFLSATPPLAAASSGSGEKTNEEMTIYFDLNFTNSSMAENSSLSSSTSSSTPSSASSTSPSSSSSTSSSKVSPSAATSAAVNPYKRIAISLDPSSGVPKVKCCYRAIYRVEQKPKVYNAAADGRWRYSGWCTPLDGPKTSIIEDSILVYCNMSNVVIYKNVHYFIQRDKVLKPSPPASQPIVSSKVELHDRNQKESTNSVEKPKVEDKKQRKHKKARRNKHRSHTKSSGSHVTSRDSDEKLSVIVFGTDSASRLNMRRHLPKTYQYLTGTLGAVDLTGFNKVGDNTFPNLVPVTIGLSQHELANHSCVPEKEKFDNCPWIWKEFKKNGFVTAFIEDSPWMGMYNYMHSGFVKQPTDFYGRAFFLASEKEIGNEKHGNSNVCQGDKMSLKVIQDYSLELARAFHDHPTFSLFWSASVSHDYLNLLHHADLPHLEYLRQLQEMGALNRTALLFVSDHGMRWGSIRSTYVGMLEERLPYVLVYLPPWFREKYKTAFSNLKRNAHRLTANYDLYETLKDIAQGRYSHKKHVTSKPRKGTRGISLFKAIPRRRRCEDAGIPGHFCTCQDTHDIPLTDPVLDMAASYLKGYLNKDLMPHPQCARFTSIELLTGRVSGSNKQLSPQDTTSDVRSYLLQGRLSPGDVVVEATIRYNPQPQVFQLTGEVSRINEYGNSSHCIRHVILRKFCFCKDLLKTGQNQKAAEEHTTQQQEQEATQQPTTQKPNSETHSNPSPSQQSVDSQFMQKPTNYIKHVLLNLT